jgi:hypothetical protein
MLVENTNSIFRPFIVPQIILPIRVLVWKSSTFNGPLCPFIPIVSCSNRWYAVTGLKCVPDIVIFVVFIRAIVEQ